ncbi:carboxypeptidase Y A [Colletotrichum liriopes]|uniref:Carboxypeptidase n=1 Tax=Colletotrichum liriopes TaxID=708192 RepID=A0AA37GT33_9PEZI|nr:carboxypeptidase Y A [Colletotrichum liriopes]
MRFSTSALVLGAASTAVALDQQVLGGNESPFDSIKVAGQNWLSTFEEKFGKMTTEAKAVWDEITLLAPDAPKPAHRKSDKKWDHVVKGADVQEMWVEKNGEKHRKIAGDLKNFNLRAKKVDPAALGVDKIVNNEWSWNNNASVIFLDQPVNVGYSYSGSSVSNTVAAGKDVYALLSLFFHQFPEYSKQDFHIAGESYAGHYIPVFASEILSHEDRNINLKSVLIGNGLTDGWTQYGYYRPMACGEGGYPAVLDEGECQAMDNALPRCQSLIKNCYDSGSVWSCVPASIYCNNALIGPYQRTGQNVYDIRGKCEDSSNLCYSALGWISEYLNQDEVKDALGAEVDSYDSCNFDINRNFLFAGDWFQPFHRIVPKLLEKIPVLIYAGDADYICNWLGNRAWTEALEWSGQKGFNKAEVKGLTVGKGDEYGKVKSSGNFTFMQLYGAGHMVPMDQPEASSDFFNRWLGGEWVA